MQKMAKAVSKAVGALMLVSTLPTASAGWVQDLCEQHRYKQSCIATVCSNVPGLCPPTPRSISTGGLWQPGGQGGSDDLYKRAVPIAGTGAPDDKRGWNHYEQQLYQLTQTMQTRAVNGEPFKPPLSAPPAFPARDIPATVEFDFGITRPQVPTK